MVCASMAFAQAGSIGIFSDNAGTDCNLWDTTAGLCSYYIVFVYHGGVTGAQFAAPVPACLLAMYMSDTTVWPVNIGDSQNGISIGTGQCVAAPTHLLTLNFFCQMLTPVGACCYYPVVAHPAAASGVVEGVDCAFVATYPTAGQGVVNNDGICLCDVPTQETTWGQVKSLFAE
jgi:hypothetical protein